MPGALVTNVSLNNMKTTIIFSVLFFFILSGYWKTWTKISKMEEEIKILWWFCASGPVLSVHRFWDDVVLFLDAGIIIIILAINKKINKTKKIYKKTQGSAWNNNFLTFFGHNFLTASLVLVMNLYFKSTYNACIFHILVLGWCR